MAERTVGIEIRRVFDAPRERVWREWTEPKAFADWFGGPNAEIPLDTVSMDVRPGGAWRLTMYAPPDRREIQWWGEYRTVEEPERLELTMHDASGQPDELIVVVLTDLGDGRTEMLLQQTGQLPPEHYEAAKRGWSSFLDRIDERLAD